MKWCGRTTKEIYDRSENDLPLNTNFFVLWQNGSYFASERLSSSPYLSLQNMSVWLNIRDSKDIEKLLLLCSVTLK